jgi:hypothetical protein
MSFVKVRPEALTAAADSLASIGSAVNALNKAAIASTTTLTPAAADEVSALTAAKFSAHGRQYQAISAAAAVIQKMFVTALDAGHQSYSAIEAANANATAT